MSTHIETHSKQVTLAELEEAIDGLAQIMVLLGKDGPKVLGLYKRLERQAEALRSRDAEMAKIYERARQAKHRSETRAQFGCDPSAESGSTNVA